METSKTWIQKIKKYIRKQQILVDDFNKDIDNKNLLKSFLPTKNLQYPLIVIENNNIDNNININITVKDINKPNVIGFINYFNDNKTRISDIVKEYVESCLYGFNNKTNAIQSAMEHFKKDTCEIKKDTCEIKKDTCEIKKDTCEIKKDTCEIKKDICEIKKDICEIKKDICEIKKDTCKKNILRDICSSADIDKIIAYLNGPFVTDLEQKEKKFINFFYEYLLNPEKCIERAIVKKIVEYFCYVIILTSNPLKFGNNTTGIEHRDIKFYCHIIVNILSSFIKMSENKADSCDQLSKLCEIITATKHLNPAKNEIYIVYIYQQLVKYDPIAFYNAEAWHNTIYANGINASLNKERIKSDCYFCKQNNKDYDKCKDKCPVNVFDKNKPVQTIIRQNISNEQELQKYYYGIYNHIYNFIESVQVRNDFGISFDINTDSNA